MAKKTRKQSKASDDHPPQWEELILAYYETVKPLFYPCFGTHHLMREVAELRKKVESLERRIG